MFSDGTDAKESHATDSVMLLLPSSSSLLYVNLMLTEADDLEPGEIRNDDSVNVNIEANLVVVEDDSKDPADKKKKKTENVRWPSGRTEHFSHTTTRGRQFDTQGQRGGTGLAKKSLRGFLARWPFGPIASPPAAASPPPPLMGPSSPQAPWATSDLVVRSCSALEIDLTDTSSARSSPATATHTASVKDAPATVPEPKEKLSDEPEIAQKPSNPRPIPPLPNEKSSTPLVGEGSGLSVSD
ncbi:hypothetical protein HID58_048227, partial [Brassica napus]